MRPDVNEEPSLKTGSREQLLYLLAEAAEIEHTLMCSYLYAVDLMHLLGSAGDALARMPASAASPGVNAGLSFTMLRGVEPLIAKSAENQLIHEHLSDLTNVARRLAPLHSARALVDRLARRYLN